ATVTSGHHLGRDRSQNDRHDFAVLPHLFSDVSWQRYRWILQKTDRFSEEISIRSFSLLRPPFLVEIWGNVQFTGETLPKFRQKVSCPYTFKRKRLQFAEVGPTSG
ncbi:unnamed protein product, partial [Prunus brigantina]